MEMTKQTILHLINESGGRTTEYPFIETGQVHKLDELVREGLLLRVTRPGDLDEIRITEKGRRVLAGQVR